MKCFNCGCECEKYLCDKCRTIEALDNVFEDVFLFKEESCKNPYILEYAESLTEEEKVSDCVEELLSFFNPEEAEYFYLRLYRIKKDERFENGARKYLEMHHDLEYKTQYILYTLLTFYLRNDLVTPAKWYDFISKTDNLNLELYRIAAEYYGMIGDYDRSDEIADKALNYCANNSGHYLYSNAENISNCLKKQKDKNVTYRTKKPYWPREEKHRKSLIKFYDERGIKYPRISKKPYKVKESDFKPITECYDDDFNDYCAFWCEDPYSVNTVKCIYRIAAVKVRDNKIVDEFQELVKPWDGTAGKKDAARQAGVPLKVIDEADDVDLVMKRFFEFTGDDLLVSTDAFGKQAKLITRAARYTGMKEIKNEFSDLLDIAADCDEKFDMENNHREFLINYFCLTEGNDALSKAKVNIEIYTKLKEFIE